MSSRRDSASGSASRRRSRAYGDGVGEESSAGRGVGIPEIVSPTSGRARCELCGVDCSGGPRLRSKKTGAYRHRECPDEATARELLREERRAARAAARGEASVTSDTKPSEERSRRSVATPRSVPSGSSMGVRWRDSGGSDDESASGTPASSRDRQTVRRRARFAEDEHRAGSPSEDSGEDRDSGTRRRRSKSREEKRRSLDGRHASSPRAKQKQTRGGRDRSRSAATHEPETLNVFDVFRELYESSPPQTRVAVGAAFSFWFVSRVSSFSAAVALAGAFASLAAIGAAAAEDFFARTARFLKTAPERFAKEKLKPALAAARVIIGWLEDLASAVFVFLDGVFATLAAAVADAARDAERKRNLFFESVEERRRSAAAKNAPTKNAAAATESSSPVMNTAETTSETHGFVPEREEDLSRPANETRQKTALPEETSVNANDGAAERMKKTNDDDVREDAPSKTPPANDAAPSKETEKNLNDQNDKIENHPAFRIVKIDLAEALDELAVTRRELEAARADAEAAKRGRAGAVERAAAAAATTTRAENRDAVESLERELASARLDAKRQAADAAAEARRVASDEHARLRETNRDLESRLAEAEHLSAARDALENAARAKAAETQRRLVEAESRHETETRRALEDRARFELEVMRKADETAENARRAAAEAVDAARRETARELLTASRAAENECARLSAVKERVERDWHLATERADAAEEEAAATLEAARAAEGFLQKATERVVLLQKETEALRGEKKHLWERVEYAEWRLAKLGLDKNAFSPEEAAVAARPGGGGGRGQRRRQTRAETQDSAEAKRKTDGAETTYGPSPGPSADEGEISADDKDSAEIGSVRRMAASIEKRAPRRSEAEALMRRVRALETEAREGTGNLADAFADATT